MAATPLLLPSNREESADDYLFNSTFSFLINLMDILCYSSSVQRTCCFASSLSNTYYSSLSVPSKVLSSKALSPKEPTDLAGKCQASDASPGLRNQISKITPAPNVRKTSLITLKLGVQPHSYPPAYEHNHIAQISKRRSLLQKRQSDMLFALHNASTAENESLLSYTPTSKRPKHDNDNDDGNKMTHTFFHLIIIL